MGVDKRGLDQLKALKDKFEKLQRDKDDYCDFISKQVALRFLRYVIPDTPTQENKKVEIDTPNFSKTYDIRGGALKRGWIGLTTSGPEPSSSQIEDYVQGLPVRKTGTRRTITITNNVEYAPYVEYGHRQRPGRYVPVLGASLVSAWVPGQYMLKRAVANTNSMMPGLIRRLTTVWLNNYFK